MEKTSFTDGMWDSITGKNLFDPETRDAKKSHNYLLGAAMSRGIGQFQAISDLCNKNYDESLEDECFVATAVYRDINAPQLDVLRDYRDNVLSKSMLGRLFIEFYYSGAGEKAAKFIEEKIPYTVPIIKNVLDFIVYEHYMEMENKKN